MAAGQRHARFAVRYYHINGLGGLIIRMALLVKYPFNGKTDFFDGIGFFNIQTCT